MWCRRRVCGAGDGCGAGDECGAGDRVAACMSACSFKCPHLKGLHSWLLLLLPLLLFLLLLLHVQPFCMLRKLCLTQAPTAKQEPHCCLAGTKGGSLRVGAAPPSMAAPSHRDVASITYRLTSVLPSTLSSTRAAAAPGAATAGACGAALALPHAGSSLLCFRPRLPPSPTAPEGGTAGRTRPAGSGGALQKSATQRQLLQVSAAAATEPSKGLRDTSGLCLQPVRVRLRVMVAHTYTHIPSECTSHGTCKRATRVRALQNAPLAKCAVCH